MDKKINIYISPLNKKIKTKNKITLDNTFNNIDWRNCECEYYNWWKDNEHHWLNECAIEYAKKIADNENIQLCSFNEHNRVFEGHTIKVFYPNEKNIRNI